MPVEWHKVPEQVLSLANDIIREYHPELTEFNIGFLFRSEAATSGGRTVLGQAAKTPAKLAPFLDLDGIIWLAEDWFLSSGPTERQALIDHELCHFEVNDAGDLAMRGHDIEEFKVIIERYGLWRSDLEYIAPAVVAATQTPLPGLERTRRQGGVVAVEPGIVEETLHVNVVGELG